MRSRSSVCASSAWVMRAARRRCGNSSYLALCENLALRDTSRAETAHQFRRPDEKTPEGVDEADLLHVLKERGGLLVARLDMAGYDHKLLWRVALNEIRHNAKDFGAVPVSLARVLGRNADVPLKKDTRAAAIGQRQRNLVASKGISQSPQRPVPIGRIKHAIVNRADQL